MSLVILINAHSVSAQTTPPNEYKMPFMDCFNSETFISGEQCFKDFNKPEYDQSGWRFIEVPVFYNKPDSTLRTKISYRLSPNFSTNKKTIIHFNGGPGGTSYGTNFDALTDFNVIYFNQRGAAFSRPENKDLLNHEDYYSSESTARDALQIVKHLGLKKVTAYGHSYGTVPATIFASLFPENTENVILEGVVFDGSVKLWTAEHRLKLVQRYFDGLDDSMKRTILKYSHHPKVFVGWFSKLAQQLMYDTSFREKMNAFLKQIFEATENQNPEDYEKQIISKLAFYGFRNISEISESIYFSSMMFKYLSCKELSADNDYSTFYAAFDANNILVPYNSTESTINFCKNLNIKNSKMYKATDFPVTVPIYYFNGTTDGATTVENAIRHYKQVAKGKAQIVLAKNDGHSPAYQYISANPHADPTKTDLKNEVVALFKAAINNEILDVSKVDRQIKEKSNFWVTTKK